jgi:hypothetical protein
MEHTDDANAFSKVLQEEIEAIDSLRDDIDEEEINFRKLFNEQLEEAEAWQHKDNKYCTILYKKLEKLIHCTLCVWEIENESNWLSANSMSIK